MALKGWIENMQGSARWQAIFSPSCLPVYLYTSIATSFHFPLDSSQADKNNTNNIETSCNC